MKFITYADLHQELQSMLTKVPPDIAGVVGIPRSGMIAASMLAVHLHLPLTSLDEFERSGEFYSAGRRMAEPSAVDGRVLLVDDTAWSGRSMREAVERLGPRTDLVTAAVFVTRKEAQNIQIVGSVVEGRRLFEWNVWNHGMMGSCLVDLDGVLCPDPTHDDDGPIYEKHITEVPRLYRPRKVKGIVTCRLEKWRAQTEAWLARTGVEYDTLMMMDYPTAAARRAAGKHAEFKAGLYAQSDAPLFVESSFRQAQKIAKQTGKGVLCTETMQLIQG